VGLVEQLDGDRNGRQIERVEDLEEARAIRAQALEIALDNESGIGGHSEHTLATPCSHEAH
jgi:hypothetical protein